MQHNVMNATPLSKFQRFVPVAASSTPFDHAKPQKAWAITYADLNGPNFSYDCVQVGSNGDPFWATYTMSDADALTVNIAVGTQSVPPLAAVPTPLDKAAVLASGLELCTEFFTGHPALCPPLTPATNIIQWTQEDHDALLAIKAKLGA